MVEVTAEQAQPLGIDLVDAPGADPLVDDQPGVLEHLQVLRDGGPAHGQFAGELPDRPRTLGEALEALEQDEVVRSALPGELYDTFVAIKRDEWHRACGAVTEWDRETYLTYIP